jgi:hypothetical protein
MRRLATRRARQPLHQPHLKTLPGCAANLMYSDPRPWPPSTLCHRPHHPVFSAKEVGQPIAGESTSNGNKPPSVRLLRSSNAPSQFGPDIASYTTAPHVMVACTASFQVGEIPTPANPGHRADRRHTDLHPRGIRSLPLLVQPGLIPPSTQDDEPHKRATTFVAFASNGAHFIPASSAAEQNRIGATTAQLGSYGRRHHVLVG